MANKKISELQSRTPALSDLMLVGDPSSGYSYKCTVTALATIIETDIADGYVTIGTTQTISGAKTFSNNLTLTSVVNTPTDPDKFLTLNASNVVTYRTGSQVLSDIGAADDSLVVHLAGTETITGYKTFSSFAGFDSAISLKQNSTIVSQAGYGSIAASSTGFFLTRATGIHAFFNLNSLTTGRNFTFPDVTGTIALTSDITDALAGYVPTSRTLTINGVTQSLAANRTFNVGTVETVNFTTGTTGTDVNVSGSPITTTGTITLNIPTASATNRGALSSTDWSTFNNKQSAISLTTTGNSGAATFVSNTLNIPNYTLSGLGGISGSGTTNYIPKFTSSSAIGNSIAQDDGTTFTIGGQLYVNRNDAPAIKVARNGGTDANTVIEFANATTSNFIGSNGSLFGLGGTSGSIPSQPFIIVPSSSERMRLDASGNLGINTSSPTTKLTIKDDNNNIGTNSTILLTSNNGFATTSYGWDNLNTNYDYSFKVSGSTKMLLDNNGNLGINTSSPAAKLHISGGRTLAIGGNENYSLGIGRESNTNAYYLGVHSTTNPNLLFSNNAGTTNMTLDYSGNLGLGVTPSAWSSYRGLQIDAQASLSSTGGVFNIGTNVFYGTSGYTYIANGEATLYQQASGVHNWRTAASGSAGASISFTQAMTLDASGNLRLGATGALATNDKLTIASTAADCFGVFQQTSGITAIFGVDGTGAYSGSLTNQAYVFRTNNTERMRITSGGNVGIGTTSPSTLLTISGSTPTLTINRVAAGNQGKLSFTDQGTEYAYIQPSGATGIMRYDVGPSAAWGGIHAFFTDQSERMRITSGGNVGIGTSNPTNKLEVVGGRTYIQTGNEIYTLGISRSGANAYYLGISNSISPDLYFSNNAGTTRVTFTDGGNVGIGTTSPETLLHIDKATAGGEGGFIFVENSAASTLGNKAGIRFATNTGASFSGYGSYIEAINTNAGNGAEDLTFGTWNGASRGERMRITSGGNVAVGSTNADPLALGRERNLAIVTTGTNAALTIVGGVASRIDFGIGGTRTAGIYSDVSNFTEIFTTTALPLVFSTNSAERMRLTSSGELLINTTSDAGDYKLQVNGSTLATNYWTPVSASNGYYLLNYNTSNASSRNWRITNDVDTYGDFGVQVATTQGGSTYTNSLILTSTTAVFNGSIKTAAPSGGNAAAWKLGERVASSGLTLNDTQYIQLDIAGTLYTLATVNLP